MEHHGRLIGVLEQQLRQYVEHHRQNEEARETARDDDACSPLFHLRGQRAGDVFEDTHLVRSFVRE